MTKALFFDIDGTLVSFETHRIPSSTIEALEAAHAKGLKIFIATGRPKAIINNLSELQDRNLIDGYITMNGAYCFVGEQVIYKSAIPQGEVKAMAAFCEKKGVPCIFVEEHHISVCQPDDMVKKIFYDFLHVNVLPTVSFEEAISKEIIQMTPFITEEEEKEIRPSIPTCEIGRWYPSFADITQECRFSRTGFSCQKDRLTGILNQIQCILKLGVVSVYAHNIIICKFVDVLICQYVVS